jgi:putative transposase
MTYLAHRIELCPNNAQEGYFRRAAGTARFAWNWALGEWNRRREAGEKVSEGLLRKLLNEKKGKDFPWMAEVTKRAPQQAIQNLGTAFDRFFKKLGAYPKFKKRGEHDSFRAEDGPKSKTGSAVKAEGRYVVLPKIGRIKMTEAVRFPGRIMEVVVSREADRWFASFVVETEHVPQHGEKVIGVDLGVKDAVVLSTGERFPGPKPLRKRLRKLKRLSRQHSRKVKGSRNRRKSAMRLARLHRRIKNTRKDFLHKVTTHIVSRAKTVVVEDLNVKGMLSNRKLSRAISDIGFGEFRRQLDYKAELNEVALIVANRWFPSTKLCRKCGTLNDLSLAERTYRCDCGHEEDRHLNAARNLRTLAESSSDKPNACGPESSGSGRKPRTKLYRDEAGTFHKRTLRASGKRK